LHHIEHDTDATVDGEYIKDMLIPVSYHDATRLHRLWGFVNWVPDEGEKYFTCKHWDPETRLCTDYENRPGMCRRYGTTKACRHGCGCGNV
jgi:Fe-S-cluster containining protein